MQTVKNKLVTYLLILAVVAVWGIILYRVFFNNGPDDDETKFLTAKVQHEPYDQYQVKDENIKLQLNYRDPFSGNAVPKEIADSPAVSTKLKVLAQPLKVVVSWPSIRYTGYITNPKTKKVVSILVVNDQERMIAEGESFKGIKLLKNKRDSILVIWMGTQKYIRQ